VQLYTKGQERHGIDCPRLICKNPPYVKTKKPMCWVIYLNFARVIKESPLTLPSLPEGIKKD
jgi:hypothetical protein